MMSEVEISASPVLFPAGRYEAFEAFVFESSTRLNGKVGLLGLPTPHLPDDLYPHSGKLQEEAYRTPWAREKVFSACKLSLGSSPFEDLDQTKQPVVSLERFIVWDEAERIPSSNPDLMGSDLDDYLFEESHTSDPCQESFVKCTPENKSEGHFLPEEILPVDHLAQFRRHLPTLKAKLSRLRILPVADPLLSSTGGSISEDAVFSCFQRCESYEKPPDVVRTHVETCAHIRQEFVKEPLINKESLLLPDVLETVQPNTENCFSLWSVRDRVAVSPERLDEPRPVVQELQASFSKVSLEWISKYEAPGDAGEECTVKRDPADLAERVKLLPEMELDVTFSPTLKSPSRVCLTTSELQREELPPLCPLSLVSARTQEEMQAALWRAEKHPDFVVRFLLAESENYEPAVDFKPLHEALTAFQLEKQRLTHTGDAHLQSQMETGDLQEDWWCGRVFTESMRSESNPEREERVEVFTKLCLERVEDFTVKLNRSDKTHLLKDRNASRVNTINTNNKDVTPAATTSTNVSDEKCSGAPLRPFAPADITNRSRDDGRRERSAHLSWQAGSTRTNISNNDRGKPFSRRPPEMDYDPVSAFMMLRSQPVVSVPATPRSSACTAATPGEGPVEQTPETPLSQPPLSQTQHPSANTPDQRPGHMRTVISGKAIREQNSTPQWMGKVLGCRLDHQERPDSTVVQVEATDSQERAYRELQAFALPCLSSARQLGLNIPAWGDFSRLAPDQTHFLLKQQERALHRSPGQSTEPARSMKDQELLLNQATLIHSLVTFKELLLKCDLRTALDYLGRAAKGCAEKSLQELLKRQQIIFFLSQRNHEPNLKLQELQRLLAERLQSRDTEHNVTGKILVIISADSDDSFSAVVTSLKQATGAAVTAVYPQKGMKKLNGANMVSSMQACVCVVVCEQHIGPDFPWSCFSLLVEYDHPGHSPWSTVCRERNIGHLAFNTCISDAEDHDSSWHLQDNVPYVLLVTERLLNCPLLLQSLESNFTISVLERSSSPTLQMLGGLQKYAVITVDENTVIVIQEQDELCQERVSETLVLRLIALSLQYSCCWLVLHCPDSQNPEFHGEAFSNLVLLYSSLVVFNMKSEFDLDVKVLMVSDMLDMAKWISQICFSSLMCSDRDAFSYLSRDWLTVMPSQDELYLSQFPCINPLVAQLMLSRAPSLQWLLRAPLPQLKELLPEVSHKVVKLFTDITAQYLPSTDQSPSGASHQSSPPLSLWSQTLEHANPSQADPTSSFLFGAGDMEGSFSEPDPDPAGQDDNSDFSLDFPSCSFGSWTSGDPWRKKEEEKLHVWTSRAGAVGGVVERRNDDQGFFLQNPESPSILDSTFSWSPVQWPPEHSHMSTLPVPYCDLQHHPAPGGPSLQSSNFSEGGGMTAASENYGSRHWVGRERKRSGEEAGLFGSVLTPLKRKRLSYEKIPGRSDGQTRLRLL